MTNSIYCSHKNDKTHHGILKPMFKLFLFGFIALKCFQKPETKALVRWQVFKEVV